MKNVLLMIIGGVAFLSSCSKEDDLENYVCSCIHRTAANEQNTDVSSEVMYEFSTQTREEAKALCIDKEYRDGGFDMSGGGWVDEIKGCALK